MTVRVVVLVSGSGTLLQALLDADLGPAQVVAVGSDRADAYGLARAQARGVTTYVVPLVVSRNSQWADRAAWDAQLTAQTARYQPDLIVCAGFMRLLGPVFLERFAGHIINSHPALLPSFPGAHGVRDALAYGVKISGATVFYVDAGVDTGPIIDQVGVRVEDDDTTESLHERIKVAERQMLVRTVTRLANQRKENDV